MKKFFLLFILLSAYFYSCAGEKETCAETGCEKGKHCVVSKNICKKDCTDEYCAQIGQACNPITKECEESCKETGCESGYVCNETTNRCEISCLTAECSDGYHCNLKKQVCEKNCTPEDCNTQNNEVCDPESHICVVKAQDPCKSDDICPESSHCNLTTGHCVGGCADIECAPEDVCSPTLLRCLHACTPQTCRGETFCNPQTKLCESYSKYPEGPYGTNKNDVIKPLKWTDTDGKPASLKMLHNMYLKIGYPRVILLVESAGWCSPCRQEAPVLNQYYKEMIDPDSGLPRLAIIQTIVDDNSQDGQFNGDPDAFASQWKNDYNMDFSVVGDDGRFANENGFNEEYPLLVFYNQSGSIPFNILINARTMQIIDFENGTDEEISGIKLGFEKAEKKVLCGELNCEENGKSCVYNKNKGKAYCH